MRRFFFGITAAVFAAGWDGAPAAPTADEGQALWNGLRQHGYGILSIDSEATNRQLVEAEINGHRVRLVVDTGANRTCLTRSCARDLGLDIHDIKQVTLSVGGPIAGVMGEARVASFKLGAYEINRTDIVQVLAKGGDTTGADGLLGYDFLHANAVILPVGAKILFYKPGNALPADIRSSMQAFGLQAIALNHGSMGMTIGGSLNGNPLTALIDCGAGLTIFSLNFVRDTAKADPRYVGKGLSGVDGRFLPAFTFTPASLTFGSLRMPPSEMMAEPSPVMTPKTFQVLLGFDLLAQHQAIIDLGHDDLWMK